METTVKEVWLPIIGFSSYKISNLGNVMSYKTKGKQWKLTPSRTGDSFILTSDTGDKRSVTKKRLLYAATKGVPYDSIVGFVVGPVDDLKNISKEEFYAKVIGSIAGSRVLNADDVVQFYEESAKDIEMIRQFYKTGDMAALAEYLHGQSTCMIRYTMKVGRHRESVAADIWDEVLGYTLIGFHRKGIMVSNIAKYLKCAIRTEIAKRKRKTTREVSFNEYAMYTNEY